MDEPRLLPTPRWLAGFAHPAIEDSLRGLAPEAQRRYRLLLAEEAARGVIGGHALPAARALERLLAEQPAARRP